MFAYLTAITFGLFSFCSTLFTPLIFILRIFGYHYYIIRNDNEKTKSVSKKLQLLTYNSINLFTSGQFNPSGSFINTRCVGYYNHFSSYADSMNAEIHIMTTPAYFQVLFESERTSISFAKTESVDSDGKVAEKSTKPYESTTNSLTLYSRVGSYMHLFYNELRIDVQGLEPQGQQIDIVNQICSQFSKKRRGAFFIHGISGAGKSTIGLLLACRLKGTYCHTFCPTDPGDTLTLLLRDTKPTDDKPTIILIEEANTMIHIIHNGTFTRHKNITTLIHNKSTYNTFMDDLILYRNVILIFTSNESKDDVDKLDPCYLRKGRIDDYFSMSESLQL
jgi:hypothetical protein